MEDPMSVPRDPQRLSKLAGQSSVLGRGIVAAQSRGPDEAQLRALEQNVMGTVAVSAAAVTAAAAVKGAHVSAGAAAGWLSAGSAKLVVALVATTMVGGGAVAVRHVAKAREDAGRARVTAARAAVHTPPLPKSVATSSTTELVTESERPVLAPPAVVSPPVAPPSPPGASPPSAIRTRSPAATATPRAGASASASAAPAHDDETALLVQAHQALAADPTRALTLVQEHSRRFPGSSMDEERDLIAVTALVNLDRMFEARGLAERFSDRHPFSTYAEKVKSLVASKP
jgi:hypothetical protein